ncbi:MAG TPA: acyl-CoA dehydrogenase [Candidatus Hydrogenedentes bacterium]|nr:acyl-CoA dehydrogenase [Candidatus Hydrogenedentota bacterium]
MNVTLTEEQTMLQDSARKFVENEVSLEKVRELANNPKGLTDELWNAIAEQGWLGILVPEDLGGLGMGAQELGVVAYELGRGIVPGPFMSTTLATNMIAQGGTDAAKAKYIENLVAGASVGTLAIVEPELGIDLDATACTATPSADGFTLSGQKDIVPDALAADVFVVAAKSDSGVGFYIVDKDAEGLTVTPNKVWDLTSRSGTLKLENVQVSADAEILNPQDVFAKTLRIANIIISADSLAGAEYIHKLTVAYAKERTQFGTLIGSFQSVKHPLVDLFALIESAKSAFHYATWAVDADDKGVEVAVAVARNTNVETYRTTTQTCLQLHGGIGFTWEYDLHLFLKRARHNQFLFGDADYYDELICQQALCI